MKKVLNVVIMSAALLMTSFFTGCSDIMNAVFGNGSGSSSSDSGVDTTGVVDTNPDEGEMYNQDISYSEGDSACFFCEVLENNFIKKSFTLKSAGTYCNVWKIDKDNGYMNSKSLSDSVYKSMAEKFDSIYQDEIAIFGSNKFTGYDNFIASSPAKINIIVFDISGDSSSVFKGGTSGYFYSIDVFKNSYYSASNATEVFYIDSQWLDHNINVIYTTLVHEFQHMLHYVNKVIINKNSFPDTWFNEMLSEVAADIFMKTLGVESNDGPMNRLADFNEYHNLGLLNWRTGTSNYDPDGDLYISYANSYAFGAYLLRNYGGILLIHQILTNSYSHPTYNSSTGSWSTNDSVSMALKALGYSETFESVWKKFYQVLINTESVDYDSETLSLNKGFIETFNSKEYTITRINLNGEVPGKSGSKPLIYGLNESLKYPIGSLGFSIHKSSGTIDTSSYYNPSGKISLRTYSDDPDYYLIKENLTDTEVAKDQAGYLTNMELTFGEGDRSAAAEPFVFASGKIQPKVFFEDPEKINKLLGR